MPARNHPFQQPVGREYPDDAHDKVKGGLQPQRPVGHQSPDGRDDEAVQPQSDQQDESAGDIADIGLGSRLIVAFAHG